MSEMRCDKYVGGIECPWCGEEQRAPRVIEDQMELPRGDCGEPIMLVVWSSLRVRKAPGPPATPAEGE